jgi:hypothetical protein
MASSTDQTCLHIDYSGQGVMEIATDIRMMAYVPVQVWKG